MTQTMPVMFRAGRIEAAAGRQLPTYTLDPTARTMHLAHAGSAATAEVFDPQATAARTYLADVSEFQPNVIDQLYANWSKAIVVRAMYGANHVDNAWYNGDRRNQLHQYGMEFLALYQYVVAGQDPAAQAKALAQLIGPLRPGEIVIADIEEGSGSQQQRWVTWAEALDKALGFPPWDYSGLSFAAAHALAPVDWVAAYGQAEPDAGQKLWQFTDALQIPGIGTCDCSVGPPIAQLAAMTYQGKSATSGGTTMPAAPPATDWDWNSDGKFGLDVLASSHHTKPSTLLWKTLGTHSQPAFNSYVDAGNWTTAVPAGVIVRFPAGH